MQYWAYLSVQQLKTFDGLTAGWHQGRKNILPQPLQAPNCKAAYQVTLVAQPGLVSQSFPCFYNSRSHFLAQFHFDTP
eukprot:5091327-Amphidinium_carterae.1